MNTTPTIIILVGITGDLSKRKLLPAIQNLREQGKLPEYFALVGITRHENDQGYFQMDLDNPDDYVRLSDHLKNIEKEWGVPGQRLFYLSVAPTVSPAIIGHLGASGLSAVPHTKLLLEKPFALDLGTDFAEAQVYRVDHYLFKNTVRALPALDLPQGAKITVEAAESIGIEGRGHFYEQTGALRDVVQSHLAEVAAQAIAPQKRLEALKELSFSGGVRRGQYQGYREAVQNPESVTETYASIELTANGPLFAGTVVLKTGKGMSRKHTDLTIEYTNGAVQVLSLDDTHNAYEHVFAEAIQGNKQFFISQEEVAETIRIIDPIEKKWKESGDDLFFYEQGTDPN